VAGFLQGFASVAAGAATDPPRVTFPPGVSCPAVAVYASRGSGEAFDDSTLGAGSQLEPLYADLVAEYGSTKVGLEANGYPAAPIVDPWFKKLDPYYLLHDYKPSVMHGVADAVADITAYANKCRKGYHTLVVAGYSQGADVVRRAMARIPYSSFPSRMTVQVVLFGDPNFSPSENFAFGDYHQVEGAGRRYYKLGGLSAPPAFSSLYRVMSWCHNGDPVCQAGGSLPSEHGTYAESDGFAVACQIYATVGWRIPIALASFSPRRSQHLLIYPAYFPPDVGPSKDKPSTALFLTDVDGHRVDSRWLPVSEIGTNYGFTITLPDKNWHMVSVYALGHLIEEKRIRITD
jgi:hypothetical protein